jgi:uncharacterized membrane protein YozB (DUF420 family)
MNLHQHGFLGTRGSLGADLTLVIIVAAFVLLTVGVVLARRKSYGAHRWVQTAAVALSYVPILAWMVVSLGRNIVPNFPKDLNQSAFALATVHVVIGAVAAVFGVIIVVRAQQVWVGGHSLEAYKTPMRVAYLLYLAAVVMGVVVYVVTYG